MPRHGTRPKENVSRERPKFVLHPPTVTEERQGYVWSDLTETKDAKASLYMTEIKPMDFLRLAIYGTGVKQDKRGRYGWSREPGYKELKKRFREGRPIDPLSLWVDYRTCRCTGHEGRHRASIAEFYKIKKVPVVLACSKGYHDYVPWRECTHCYGNFPKRLKPQE